MRSTKDTLGGGSEADAPTLVESEATTCSEERPKTLSILTGLRHLHDTLFKIDHLAEIVWDAEKTHHGHGHQTINPLYELVAPSPLQKCALQTLSSLVELERQLSRNLDTECMGFRSVRQAASSLHYPMVDHLLSSFTDLVRNLNASNVTGFKYIVSMPVLDRIHFACKELLSRVENLLFEILVDLEPGKHRKILSVMSLSDTSMATGFQKTARTHLRKRSNATMKAVTGTSTVHHARPSDVTCKDSSYGFRKTR